MQLACQAVEGVWLGGREVNGGGGRKSQDGLAESEGSVEGEGVVDVGEEAEEEGEHVLGLDRACKREHRIGRWR